MADSAITNTQGAKAPAILTTHENNIQSYIGTVNNHLNDLLSAENSIQSDEDTITSIWAIVPSKGAVIEYSAKVC